MPADFVTIGSLTLSEDKQHQAELGRLRALAEATRSQTTSAPPPPPTEAEFHEAKAKVRAAAAEKVSG